MKDKHKYIVYLQYGIIVFCLFFIVRYFLAHQEELKALSNFETTYIFQLALLYSGFYIFVANQLYMILRNNGLKDCSFWQWFNIFAVSNFLKLHIPQGGNVYRLFKLKKNYHFPYTSTLGSFLFFSWFVTIFFLILTAVCLFFMTQSIIIDGINVAVLFLLLAVAFILAPYTGTLILSRIKLKHESALWIYQKLRQLLEQITNNFHNKSLIIRIFALSLLTFIFNVLLIWSLCQSLDIQMHLSSLILFTTTLVLSRVINIIPGNLGLTEIVGGYLSSNLGWSFGTGVMITGLLRIVEYSMNVLIGISFARSIMIKKIVPEET